MRSHGLPAFHNPIVAGRAITFTVTPDEPVHSPQYVRAEAACRDLLPAGLPVPGQALTVADQVHYLKAVACMRAHGFENFPDPSFTDGIAHSTRRPRASITTRRSSKKRLRLAGRLLRSGLPYSG